MEHDFDMKYSSGAEIRKDSALTPAGKVCEQVKHYAMLLFGLAADLSNVQEQLDEKDLQLLDLRDRYTRKVAELAKARNAIARLQKHIALLKEQKGANNGQ